MRRLSAELGADGLDIAGSRWGSSTSASHLDSHDSTEWASVGWVDNLNEAHAGLTAHGAGAGGASWDGGGEWVVLVDVAGTLDNAEVDEGTGDEGALLGCGDVALGAWNLLSDSELGTGGESTSSSWVEDGSVWASSVSGDDVHSGADAAAWGDLGDGAAGLCHDSGHAGEGVWAGLGLSKSVRGSGFAGEDGGVDLSLLVGSGTWDHGTLDTETGGVSTCITSLKSLLVWMDVETERKDAYCDGDLAVSGNERGGCKSNEEELGEHVCGWWIV